MAKSKGYQPPTRAELQEMAKLKTSQPYELQEASSKEASFLRKLSGAKDDYDWIVANEAWLRLGFDTFTAWYTERVQPVLRSLGARPLPEIAADVVERVRADDENVPANQRHTQDELAEMAGVTRNSSLIRPRSAPRANAHGADLETQDSPDANTASSAGRKPATDDQRPGPNPPAGQPQEPDVPEDPSATNGRPETERPEVEPDAPPVEPPPAPGAASPDAGDGPEEGERATSSSSGGDKVSRNEALAAWAKDTPEAKRAEERSRIFKWLATQNAMVAGYGPDEIEDVLDGDLMNAIARFGDQVSRWVDGVEKVFGHKAQLRLVKGA